MGKQGRLALAVTAVFAFAQLASFVHLAVVPHTLDLRTGELVRCQSDHHSGDPAAPFDRDSGPQHDNGRQDCPFHAFLSLAWAPMSTVAVLAPRMRAYASSVARQHRATLRGEALYLLAPSHSPPDSTIG